MPSGSYTVQVQEPGRTGVGGGGDASKQAAPRDTSYRACAQAMVIFILLCLILILASWVPWGSVFGRSKPSDGSSAQGQYGNKTTSSASLYTATTETTRATTRTTLPPTPIETTTRTRTTPKQFRSTRSTSTIPPTTPKQFRSTRSTSTIPPTTTEEYNYARHALHTSVDPDYDTNTESASTRLGAKSQRPWYEAPTPPVQTTTERESPDRAMGTERTLEGYVPATENPSVGTTDVTEETITDSTMSTDKGEDINNSYYLGLFSINSTGTSTTIVDDISRSSSISPDETSTDSMTTNVDDMLRYISISSDVIGTDSVTTMVDDVSKSSSISSDETGTDSVITMVDDVSKSSSISSDETSTDSVITMVDDMSKSSSISSDETSTDSVITMVDDISESSSISSDATSTDSVTTMVDDMSRSSSISSDETSPDSVTTMVDNMSRSSSISSDETSTDSMTTMVDDMSRSSSSSDETSRDAMTTMVDDLPRYSNINSDETRRTTDSETTMVDDMSRSSSISTSESSTDATSRVVNDFMSGPSSAGTTESNTDQTDKIPGLAESSSKSSTEGATDVVTNVDSSDYGQEVGSTKTTTPSEVEFLSQGEDREQRSETLEEMQEEHTLKPESESVCNTSDCKVLASKMLSLMDHSAEACDNFYQYSCGALQANKAAVEEHADEDAFDRIRDQMLHITEGSSDAHRKFYDFYHSCVSDQGMQNQKHRSTGRKVIDAMGTLYGKESWSPGVVNLTDLLTRLMLQHSTPLMDVVLDVDGYHPDRFALRLTPPIFGSVFGSDKKKKDECQLGTRNRSDLNVMYDEYIRCTKNYEIYLNETEDAIKFFGLFDGFKNKSEVNKIMLETRQTIDWDIFKDILAELPSIGEMRRLTITKTYESMTIRELQNISSVVDWQALFSRLLQRSTLMPEYTVVQVYNKPYFQEMVKKVELLESRVLHNALLAMYAHDLYVDLIATHDACAREAYCLRVASNLMEDVASSLYLSSFPAGALLAMRTTAQDVFTRLRETMRKQLIDANWMDEASRSAAVSKLDNVTLAVDGGESVFMDDAILDDRMHEVEMDENNYLSNAVALSARYRSLMYSLFIFNPASPEAMWSQFLHPFSSSGIVIYRLNTIVIPYAHIWSLHLENLPDYMLMARLGFSIAHELTHHFDTVGILSRPGEGPEDKIVADKSETSYDDFTNCVGSEYSFQKSYRTSDHQHVNYTLKATLLLNERMADDAAATLSLAAYTAKDTRDRVRHTLTLPWLDTDVTDEQLYFIALAQSFCSKSSIMADFVSLFEGEHLPSYLRVNAVLRNTAGFSTAFKCQAGQEMVSSKNCDVFPNLTASADSDYEETPFPQ